MGECPTGHPNREDDIVRKREQGNVLHRLESPRMSGNRESANVATPTLPQALTQTEWLAFLADRSSHEGADTVQPDFNAHMSKARLMRI
jgi:hypothetical protein